MTTPLLSSGQQITSATDTLRAISLAEVATWVRADAALQHQTERLRKLAQFDQNAYKTAKTSLPYVVGSVFANGIRRMDGLDEATYFVLDLDHCTGLEGQVPDAIRADLSVALAFVSPSGEGLKLFFRLLDACTDAKTFSAAYRQFAGDFGLRHGFVKSVDLRTSDATRACFLAHDPTAYHNPDAMPVDWRLWLPDQAPLGEGLFDDEPDADGVVSARKPAVERPINEVAYRDVLRAINPNTPSRREKQTFVPDELWAIEPAVRAVCAQFSWELTEMTPLNYGLKVAVKQGFRRAEVNVWHGRKGFSVVRSPKTGTDPALANLLYGELFRLLFPEPVTQNVPIALCEN
ncbi:CRISPR-associated primase-polymerase type B [Spirosoma areae]